MRKFALLTAAAAMTFGTLAVSSAEARPRGYHGGGYGNHAYYGGRGRRGIGTGAAVGLGIAGLAAGAIAAGAARDAYGYDRGYGGVGYGNGGYGGGYGYSQPGYGYYGNPY